MVRARGPSQRAPPPSSTRISPRCGRSSMSMSSCELSPQTMESASYRDWLRREERGRFVVLAGRIGLLVSFLLLWEVLARTHVVNPLLTSYPSSILPTFVSLLGSSPQQPSILMHTWATASATVA